MDSPSENSPKDNSSGVGVIDKAALVVSTPESGPATLTQPVSTTHLTRLTARHIAIALEFHRLVTRDSWERFILGPRLTELVSIAGEDHLPSAAGPVLATLRDKTHESAQLYRRQGGVCIYVTSAERPIGLRNPIPMGATMSIQNGSAAQVLLAWEEPNHLHRGLVGTRFTATILSAVRRRGQAQSAEEREPGVASVSVSVRSPGDRAVATVSISGPIERMGRQSNQVHGHVVMAVARRLSEVLTDTNAV